jgi:(p)ppGpp synthase/HD superfamily hydrolase
MRARSKSKSKNATGQLHLTSRFTGAIEYARIIHIERRKGTDVPFMAHLLGVASLVMGEAGHVGFPVTEDMVIAALLHDAAEDQGGEMRLKDIEYNFGSNVARMVEGLSDSLAEDPNQKRPWPERKKAYIRRLRKEPADVRLVSAADKLYNARAILEDYREIGPRVWERFKRGREDQIWYLDECMIRRVNAREKFLNERRSTSMYSAFRWRGSPGLDGIRRVPVLRNHVGLCSSHSSNQVSGTPF